jgi:hypothetical protein
MEEQPVTSGEPRITRLRRLLLRSFPTWFRWLITAFCASGFTILGWSALEMFGLGNGEWVSNGRHGPHFNGGSGLIMLLFLSFFALYSWWRTIGYAIAFASKRNTTSQNNGSSHGE